MMQPRTLYTELEARFRAQQTLAERALTQVPDAALHTPAYAGGNSLAVLVQHIGGNLQSRFTDFLTTDGEKPTRNREAEFQDQHLPRAALMDIWAAGWGALFATLAHLIATETPPGTPVTIRTEPHTVSDALFRQLAHHSYHVGQIVLTARMLAADGWQWLSIPPGESDAFNAALMGPRP